MLITSLLQITWILLLMIPKQPVLLSEIFTGLYWWLPSTVQTVLENILPTYRCKNLHSPFITIASFKVFGEERSKAIAKIKYISNRGKKKHVSWLQCVTHLKMAFFYRNLRIMFPELSWIVCGQLSTFDSFSKCYNIYLHLFL